LLNFTISTFNQLSLDELYDLLQLRQDVFVVEQDCPYLDADGKDKLSHHILGKDKSNKIQACTRIVPPGISYREYVSIGRVVTSKESRGSGAGKALMKFSIDQCKIIFPENKIKISAQTYLNKFYTDLGFVKIGAEYLEDDIPHQAMILSNNQ